MATIADKIEAGGGLQKATIALAVSATTDGMDITVTVTDKNGGGVTAPVALGFWMSDAATGIGLTADAFSGDLTATTGAIHTALTAKKEWTVVTDATGVFVGELVDSANPTDVYAAASVPNASGITVSVTSGTNWEGA